MLFKWASITVIIQILVNVNAYIDIPINITRNIDLIEYNLPIKIGELDYSLTISYGGSESIQNILSPKSKLSQISKNKHKKKKIDLGTNIQGTITVTSLQGYSFEGWKRFFMQAFLYISQRYYHQIKVDLNGIKQMKQISQTHPKDGTIKFSPSLTQNKIYQELKKNTDFVQRDLVAIYRGINDKNARLQLGGYQQNFARGHKTGVLFYMVQLSKDDNKWMVPIQFISCIRQKGNRDDEFHISSSKMKLSLNIQTPYITLPKSMSVQIERSLQTQHNNCSIITVSQSENMQYDILSCTNMTSVDLALNLIKIAIDSDANINISLYDLRRDYNDQTKTTTFYVRFTDKQEEWTLGQSIFKSNYMVLDMQKSLLMFSPVNRFPEESYGVYIIRFIVGFILFLMMAGCGAMIWQTFNDPFRKNKFEYGQDGVRLVSYQKPSQYDD